MLLGTALVGTPATAAPHAPPGGIAELDRQVVATLERLAAGDVERAAVLARALARRYPRFALGRLLHAELSAQAAFDDTLTGPGGTWSPALIELLLEARARLAASARAPSEPPPAHRTTLPWPLVQLASDVESLVLVDLERSSLALYAVHDGEATPLRRHYVSSGSAGFGKRREGDRKTPLGLYHVVGRLSDAALPELYGGGALVLDYPNGLDRARGRTGSGIWLHGVPRARLSRGPRSSEGCVTMSNEHLAALMARLDGARTLVVLSDGGPAPEPAARAEARERHRALFRDWRAGRLARAGTEGGTETDSAKRLSAAELAALARLDENDVTILESGDVGRPGAPPGLVMEFRLGAGHTTAITLWWRRTGVSGWRLELEDVSAVDA